MTGMIDLQAQLLRMEEARRQTQHRLEMIERQITRKLRATDPLINERRREYPRRRSPNPWTWLQRYRANLAALTAERQPEIDALARKLARQDTAIAALRSRLVGDVPGSSGRRAQSSAIFECEVRQ
ncbi:MULTISPECIES: hypothetical protein [unclassified Rhizobium]|uniref:hypothetical protein n=1 Tax=unclassified Rhizobium TaxID=2613769 RepID=UPI001FFE1054|nr:MULTISPECIES: hypothetical protein [unclassified Rhizobium]